MATVPNSDTPLSEKAQDLLLKSCNAALDHYASQATELRTKMEVIDIAYARYKMKDRKAKENGQAYDVRKDCEFDDLKENFIDVDIPLLVSQVDTGVGYMADLYLSGYPIFPVVSEPKDRREAEYIESLVDKHATIGQYPSELLKFFQSALRYNFAPLLVEWDYMQHYQRVENPLEDQKNSPGLESQDVGYTKLGALDPYNTFYDMTCDPSEVAYKGDYVGYVERMSPTQLYRLIEKLKTMPGHLMNSTRVMETQPTDSHYHPKPQISHYISPRTKEFTWNEYFDPDGDTKKKRAAKPGSHEISYHYRRLVPKDYKIPVPSGKGTELRIYKIIVVNGKHVLYAEPVYTAMERLPILIGAPRDDGFGLQTQSVAESVIPMQKAASGLVNIRFHSARRAINDRAIYDEDIIDGEALNNPSPSAKIAAKRNALSTKKLTDSYYSIPYDGRGTDGVMNDALMVGQWTNELNGMNRAQQGQFQKGNKTQDEFSTVMSNAEMRQRLPAIMLEFQVFVPLKQMLKLNLWRHASGEVIRSQSTGHTLEVDLNNLDQSIFDFRIADGYTPKNKLASTEMITAGMQMIQSSEMLQQAYGQKLPEIVAHMMNLGGVRGFDQYLPEAAQQGAQGAPPQDGAPTGAPTPPETTSEGGAV